MAAHTNASAIPVFPLVASTIVVRPGSILPSRSAASIIETPIRSLTLPPGLNASSFANSSAPGSPSMRVRATIGVRPTWAAMLLGISGNPPGTLREGLVECAVSKDCGTVPAHQMIGLIWLSGWVAAYVAHALRANWEMGPQSVWRAGDVSVWGPTKEPIGYVQRKENKRRARHDAYVAGGGGHAYLGEFASRRDAIRALQHYSNHGDVPGAQPVASNPAPEPSTRLTDELERLASLHKDGVLTDEEFATAKARVLSQDR